MLKKKTTHNKFKLQGKSFNSEGELLIFSKSLSNEVFDFLNEWFNDSSFIIVKTSGSTGKPKEIKLQKKHMINSAKATGAFFNLFEDTTSLLCMSAEYIAGKMMIVRSLVLGWDLTIVEPLANPLKDIEGTFDFCAMVPLQVKSSLNDLHKVNKLIIGGGALSSELQTQLQQINTYCFATYGMTETITHIAVKKLNNFENVIASKTMQSFYKSLPNMKLSIDERNCLVVSAPEISNETIITNDLIKLISGTKFDWLGRYDNIINSGGIKLIPEQIEAKLSQIIEKRFFVYGKPDESLGDKLVLIVEGVADDSILNEVKFLKALTKYETPKEIIFVNEFMETESKKIDRIKTFLKFTQI